MDQSRNLGRKRLLILPIKMLISCSSRTWEFPYKLYSILFDFNEILWTNEQVDIINICLPWWSYIFQTWQYSEAYLAQHTFSEWMTHIIDAVPCMALANLPIRSRSNNKRRNLWVEWCVYFWWPWFWSVYPIYYYIHTMHYSCILSDWNKSFLRDIYTYQELVWPWRSVGWYAIIILSSLVSNIFQLYSSGFSIS